MATDLSWKDAIVRVLEQTSEAMHYTQIAEEIDSKGLKRTLGATPANTIAAQISISRKNEGQNSPFDRVGRGLYRLKEAVRQPASTPVAQEEDVQGDLIRGYGLYWERQDVDWTRSRILGAATPNSDPVDMSAQIGVYLLYDGREAVYAGRASEESMGRRLKAHTRDRLKTRWNRFSWFGLYDVAEKGELRVKDTSESCTSDVIKALEAVLIEALEPRQNRQQGEGLRNREYMQVKDPELAKKDLLQQLQSLISQN